MGCFLACFGFKDKKRKKRQKPTNRNSSSLQQDNQSYVPLDSNLKEDLTSDISQLKEKPSILKLKKKVRFNLNVKAYEPIPDDDEEGGYLSEGEEDTIDTAGLHYEEDAIVSYPASYNRYQNCRYSDDEEEAYDDDTDLDEIEESDEEVDDVSIESDSAVTKNQIVDLQQLQMTETRLSARQYASSVLIPVENLSQWRVIKAKDASAQLKQQKENLNLSNTNPHSDSKMRNRVAVDASLSNWLGSLETSPLIKSSVSGQRLGL